MEPPKDNRRATLVGVILCVVTFCLYLGILKAQFVNFDDEAYVTQNTYVQNGITAGMLSWALTSG